MTKKNTKTTTPVSKDNTGIDMSAFDTLPTKSAKIRAMAAAGHKRGAIAKALNIRYQHVRNVLVSPLKSA